MNEMPPTLLPNRIIREKIVAFLQADLPSRKEKFPGNITLPVDWDGYDPLDVIDGKFPSVGVHVGGISGHSRRDVDTYGGGNEIHSTWQVGLSISCMNEYLGLDEDGVDEYQHPGRKWAIDNCEDLTILVREAILDSPAFNRDIRSNDESVRLVDNSLDVNFSEPMRPNNDRSPIWVAISQIQFRVEVDETIVRPRLGIVRTIHPHTGVLPK